MIYLVWITCRILSRVCPRSEDYVTFRKISAFAKVGYIVMLNYIIMLVFAKDLNL